MATTSPQDKQSIQPTVPVEVVEKSAEKKVVLQKSVKEVEESLVSSGWVRKFDEFEEETTLTKEGSYVHGCGSGDFYLAVGLVVQSKTFSQPLTMGLLLYGHDDLIRPQTLQWKSKSGNSSHKMVCSSEFSSGSWDETCMMSLITLNEAISISETDFVRIDATTTNIDLKSDSEKCSGLLDSIKQISGEYVMAISNQ